MAFLDPGRFGMEVLGRGDEITSEVEGAGKFPASGEGTLRKAVHVEFAGPSDYFSQRPVMLLRQALEAGIKRIWKLNLSSGHTSIIHDCKFDVNC